MKVSYSLRSSQGLSTRNSNMRPNFIRSLPEFRRGGPPARLRRSGGAGLPAGVAGRRRSPRLRPVYRQYGLQSSDRATVDRQDLAGDPVGVVADEEKGDAGELFDRADAPDGHLPEDNVDH